MSPTRRARAPPAASSSHRSNVADADADALCLALAPLWATRLSQAPFYGAHSTKSLQRRAFPRANQKERQAQKA